MASRTVAYATSLQATYDHSYHVLRAGSTEASKPSDRVRWALEAKRTRGFDIDITQSLDSPVYLVLGGEKPRIIFPEGYLNAAYSFAFTIANLQIFGGPLEEYQYWIHNFYDAAKWGDPIPYFGGFDNFHRFFIRNDFDFFGGDFFAAFLTAFTISRYVQSAQAFAQSSRQQMSMRARQSDALFYQKLCLRDHIQPAWGRGDGQRA